MPRTGSASNRATRTQLEVVLAAFVFAASVPAGKQLAADVSAIAFAGVLYLVMGLVLGAALLAPRILGPRGRVARAAADPLAGRDWLWLASAVLCGGVLAPLALFAGLHRVQAHVAGLLLELEAVFTVALAMLLHHERLGPRAWCGAAAIVLGGGLLALSSSGDAATGPDRLSGVLLVTAACLLWAADNNLMQRISGRDARQIVAVKGIAGGVTNLALAAAFGQLGGWTAARLGGAALVGALSYSVSLLLFLRGLRRLGVARTSTLFALSPGFAALLSWIVLREPVHADALLALALMTGGGLAVASERHEHLHHHDAGEHEHVHAHDEHHAHEHGPEELVRVPHTHPHRHEHLVHAHAHVHDEDHRHGH